jgi:hypothetical protein
MTLTTLWEFFNSKMLWGMFITIDTLELTLKCLEIMFS